MGVTGPAEPGFAPGRQPLSRPLLPSLPCFLASCGSGVIRLLGINSAEVGVAGRACLTSDHRPQPGSPFPGRWVEGGSMSCRALEGAASLQQPWLLGGGHWVACC